VFYNRDFAGLHLVLLGLVALVAWATTRGRFGHVLLFTSLFFNQVGFDYRGLNVRLDYLVCASLLVPNVGHLRELWRTREAKYVVLLLLTFALSSMMLGIAPGYSLRKLTILVIYAVTAAVVLAPGVHGEAMENLIEQLLRTGNLVLLLSLLGFALFQEGTDIGFIKDRETAWLRGPMLNPNLFGSTAAVLGLLNLGGLLRKDGACTRAWLGFVVAGSCVFLSYTRAAWLLFAAGGMAMILWAFGASRGLRFAPLLVAALACVAVVNLDRIGAALGFEEKLVDLLQLRTGTGLARVVMVQEGLQDWLGSPLLGKGFQSFDLVLGADQDPTVVQQMVLTLQVLQYGGLVALFWLVAFATRLHRDIWQAKRVASDAAAHWPLGAMLLGFDVLLAAYQATSGIVLPFFWFYAFLLVHLAQQRLERAETPAIAPVTA
jgi:hypothetical protein